MHESQIIHYSSLHHAMHPSCHHSSPPLIRSRRPCAWERRTVGTAPRSSWSTSDFSLDTCPPPWPPRPRWPRQWGSTGCEWSVLRPWPASTPPPCRNHAEWTASRTRARSPGSSAWGRPWRLSFPAQHSTLSPVYARHQRDQALARWSSASTTKASTQLAESTNGNLPMTKQPSNLGHEGGGACRDADQVLLHRASFGVGVDDRHILVYGNHLAARAKDCVCVWWYTAHVCM